jgi:hypothetical protein
MLSEEFSSMYMAISPSFERVRMSSISRVMCIQQWLMILRLERVSVMSSWYASTASASEAGLKRDSKRSTEASADRLIAESGFLTCRISKSD